jgi:hypothetical protein
VRNWGESPAEDLGAILRRKSLRLQTEDALVGVISKFPATAARAGLLCEVECEYLTDQGIADYLNMLSLDDINMCHWQSICRRLRRDIRPVLPGSRFIGKLIEHRPGADFDGILAHLKSQNAGNVRAAVVIEASSQGKGDPYDVTKFGEQVTWFTGNVPKSWLQFDFKDRSVSVTSYTMKSRQDGAHIPRNWVLEGKNADEKDWVKLDRHANDGAIQGGYSFQNFKCPDQSETRLFRYIRLRQIGPNSYNQHFLQLCNFELFGRLTGLTCA